MKIKYKPMVADQDITIVRGGEGVIENNLVNCYMGEWIVFKYPIGIDGAHAEVRFPLEYGTEHRLVVPADQYVEDRD